MRRSTLISYGKRRDLAQKAHRRATPYSDQLTQQGPQISILHPGFPTRGDRRGRIEAGNRPGLTDALTAFRRPWTGLECGWASEGCWFARFTQIECEDQLNALSLKRGGRPAAPSFHARSRSAAVSGEHSTAMQAGDSEKMQEQELKADGIVALTLEHLGSSPDRLVSAVQKLMHCKLAGPDGKRNAASLAQHVRPLRVTR